MPNPARMLSRYLADFDLTALGNALGQELAARLMAPGYGCVPVSEVTLSRADLELLLGQAAERGVERFVDAAGLRATVEGVPDEAAAALAATVDTVRAAVALICTDPESKPQAERAVLASQGVHLLLQLVHGYDEASGD